MPTWEISVIVLACLLVLLLLLWLLLSYKVFRTVFKKGTSQKHVFKNKKLTLDFSPAQEWIEKKGYQTLQLTSSDGLLLKGKLVRDPSSHLFFLCCHGYRGNWHSHTLFASDLNKHLEANFFFNDHRSCGDSEGSYLTMAYKEEKDLKQWIEEIVRLDKDAVIVLYGVSLGGSTVLRTLGDDLNSHVKAVIADSSYFDAYEECSFIVHKTLKGLTGLTMKGVNMYAKLILKINLADGSLQKSLEAAQIPVLLLHSEQDDFVPFSNLDRIYQALPATIRKTEKPFKEAPHALVYYFNKEEYIQTVLAFLQASQII
jgi:alpha-beta hydrolase superfamily lysophospholipase